MYYYLQVKRVESVCFEVLNSWFLFLFLLFSFSFFLLLGSGEFCEAVVFSSKEKKAQCLFLCWDVRKK